MIAVLQRVDDVTVEIDHTITAATGEGLLVLLGVSTEDTESDAELLADKIAKMRIFEDSEGKMNLSILDTQGEIMVVSNFTLLAAYRKGNRPDYLQAAIPEKAKPLYEHFISHLEKQIPVVKHGIFGADMKIKLTNNGPVTIVMDSNVLKQPKR